MFVCEEMLEVEVRVELEMDVVAGCSPDDLSAICIALDINLRSHGYLHTFKQWDTCLGSSKLFLSDMLGHRAL